MIARSERRWDKGIRASECDVVVESYIVLAIAWYQQLQKLVNRRKVTSMAQAEGCALRNLAALPLIRMMLAEAWDRGLG